MPLFSIIVPAYNAQHLIESCINSTLKQTEPDFELIIVDDGSSDNTLSVIRKYAKTDNRIRVFHQQNKGHTGARNAGLSYATGEYVLFLDCDDALETNVLEQCKKALEESLADIVVFGICRETPRQKLYLKNLVADGIYHLRQESSVVSQLLMSQKGTFTFPKSLSGKVFRRALIANCQPDIPREILIGEDGIAFVNAILLAEKIHVISHVNYLYYIRDNSVSYSQDRLAFQRFATLLEYYRNKIVPLHPSMEEQFDRLIVAQLDTAVRMMLRSHCSKEWFWQEWKRISSPPYIQSALKNARFHKKCFKMQLKQFLLRHQLFWLSKLLFRI